MDYTGNCGTNEAVQEYSEYLSGNYNILIHHQLSWSPKTSMLDLGAWVTLQPKVRTFHLRNTKYNNVLACSAKKAWNNVEARKLSKI